MARIRSDKPEAYQSETLAEISLAAERTFKGMATIADDRGRLADKPAQINGELWSMRGNHTRDDLEAELAEMVKVDLVCRYTGCDGKRYLHLVRWDSHQKIDRPSRSRLPRCREHQAGDHPGDKDCGLHEGACIPPDYSTDPPEPSRDTREPSRDLQQVQTGQSGNDNGNGQRAQGELITGVVVSAQANGHPHSDLQEQQSSRDTREPSMQDLGSRTVDRGSVPPTAGTAKPRRRLSPAEAAERTRHVGEIVAAFADGATGAGLMAPPASLRSRVGKQAKDLLAQDWDIDFLINSARRMGATEFNDLGTQVRKDDARAKGAPPGGQAESPADQRVAQAQDLKARFAARRQEAS